MLSIVLLAPGSASALLEIDAVDCKDPAAVTKVPGCIITECRPRESDSFGFQISGTKKTVEGRVNEVVYECSKRIPAADVVKNFDNAFMAKGFKQAFYGKAEDDTTKTCTTFEKKGTWAQICVHPYGDTTFFEESLVTPKASQVEFTADANVIETELKNNRGVAVYGIQFEFNQTTLKPESAPALSEILAVLKRNPAWKVSIEGHTDNDGSNADHVWLSKERAKVVADWLVKHQIPSQRLSTTGYGEAHPVASNTSEEGRAKNRRFELVRKP